MGVSLRHETDKEMLWRKLYEAAINGLAEMYDAETKLFCFRVRRIGSDISKEGFSLRYTIISLLGLHQVETAGLLSPIDIHSTIPIVLQRFTDIKNVGDLGLLLWLCSLAAPQRLEQFYFQSHLKEALSSYPDALQGCTMELAWLLTGLSLTAMALKQRLPSLPELAAKTFNIIKENYGGKGIFGHTKQNTFKGIVRGKIGSFADQVYPMYALSKFTQAFSEESAGRMALECAETICCLQGPLGQWWWHYDASSGHVLGEYPVYSVHQDAMAPMALDAVTEIRGVDFSESISKGIQWITGSNELGTDLIDTENNVIWRSIQPRKHRMYSDQFLSLFTINRGAKKPENLKINYECRPYHLGWILYAIASQ